MKKKMLLIILLLCFTLFFHGCSNNSNGLNNYYNSKEESIDCFVNDVLDFGNNINYQYVSSDSSIFEFANSVAGQRGYAKKIGECVVYRQNKINKVIANKILVRVLDNKVTSIKLNGYSDIKVNESINLYVDTTPSGLNCDVCYSVSSSDIATINSKGVLTGLKSGIVTVRAELLDDSNIYDEITLYIKDSLENNYPKKEVNIDSTKEINKEEISGLFEPIINKVNTSIVGLNLYGYKSSFFSSYYTKIGMGTATIYKRFCLYDDGTCVLDDGLQEGYIKYRYYCLTAKSLMAGATDVTAYYNDEEIKANILGYDDKVDIAVISFDSGKYFSPCVFGDSSLVNTGDFVLSIGNLNKFNQSATYGICSFANRYISTDTTGDKSYDWDALYIQHDCAISDDSSGGALVNLKGEVIAINSTKIISSSIDNMNFSIPINTIVRLIPFMEKGEKIERAIFDITCSEVKKIINDGNRSKYNIPNDIDYGIYVSEVANNGIGKKAGLDSGDIILAIDDTDIKFTYELRAILNEVVVGSNTKITLIVYRDNKVITLEAIF